MYDVCNANLCSREVCCNVQESNKQAHIFTVHKIEYQGTAWFEGISRIKQNFPFARAGMLVDIGL
jgi:hypothetical protein